MLKLPSDSRIFLTGGTGFLGRTLLDYVLACQDSQIAVDILCRNPAQFKERFPQYAQTEQFHFIQGNILEGISPGKQYSHVIHAAADTHAIESNPIDWIKQIVFGTENILDFAIKAQAQRFLFLSSGAVYGSQPSGVAKLSENYCGAPDTTLAGSVYGQAKRLAEQICTAQNHTGRIETVIARCFAFGGKHVPINGPYAFGNFLRDALYADKIIVKGDGSAVRSYLSGEDTAEWLFTLLIHGHAGHAYNVGSDQPVSMRELANKMRDLLAPEKEVVIEKSQTADNAARSIYIPSIHKANSLGLRQKISLEETITETALYLKQGK